jgi:photosystem II stability/assembly factor-like uncharacterized protein
VADRLLISTRKGLFILRRSDSIWAIAHHAFIGENVTLTLPDPRDGRIYAALNLGHFGVKLKASDDGGQTWSDLAVPAYPEGEQLVTGDGKPPVPATLKMIWSLEAGGAEQSGRLWAGTLPGGLFRSDDGGQTWALNRGLWERPERPKWFGGGYDTPGIHSICVDPRDSKTIRVAVSCGGVWNSTDDGATWELLGEGLFAAYMPPELRGTLAIQDVHRMVHCPGSPDELWIQHHNGIFRSTDGAAHWQNFPEVAPSDFGFAVAVHPRDGKTAWFVPAKKDECRVPVDGKLVVTRTRDGGKSFDILREGLPQEHAYDLVYRHALDVDETGDRLAIGSTTGGLWTSADGGDRWIEVSTQLPPIHAVRFG